MVPSQFAKAVADARSLAEYFFPTFEIDRHKRPIVWNMIDDAEAAYDEDRRENAIKLLCFVAGNLLAGGGQHKHVWWAFDDTRPDGWLSPQIKTALAA